MFDLTCGHLLFVHAHPDDETLATGGTIARLVDEGFRVSVLTATRGERGDIVPGSLAGRPVGDLVAVRLAELASALSALGVQQHYWLGEPPARADGAPARRYADSGMQWSADGTAVPAADVSQDSLTAGSLEDESADLLALINDIRPGLVISYDPAGGYGHPDHLRVHQIARSAAKSAGTPFAAVIPPQLADPDFASADPDFARADPEAGALITIDVAGQLGRRLDALRGYRTQLEQVHSDHLIHVGGQRQELATAEYFRRYR